MTFSTVFVAGAGFMGSSIAYLVATKTRARVLLYDIYPAALEKAEAAIEKMGASAVEKGFIEPEQLKEAVKRIKLSEDEKEAQEADLVIEAIAEDMQAKKELLAVLDRTCSHQTIFASNTSSLSITALAAATSRPKQFLGMHFFSPAHVMKLLEIIPGLDTAVETTDKVRHFGQSLGKVIISAKDFPGFITTRLGLVLINEAAYALMEGLSTPEEIDLGMTLGYNHPIGPLALADFVGLDICLHVMETLASGFGDPKYRPCPLIKQLVSAGHRGRKSGRGFYQYGGSG